MGRGFLTMVGLASVATFAGVWTLTGPVAPQPAGAAPAETIYYPGCDAVRAAGKAPLYSSQPGYREGMDGDGDGIACEPHRW